MEVVSTSTQFSQTSFRVIVRVFFPFRYVVCSPELMAEAVPQPFVDYYAQAECSVSALLQIRLNNVLTLERRIRFWDSKCKNALFLSGASGICLWLLQITPMVLQFHKSGSCQINRQMRPGPLLCTRRALGDLVHVEISSFLTQTHICAHLVWLM